MKKGIHPQFQDITFTCACGATFTAGSTISKDFHTEICSNCHPFYTGKQKLIDSSGRVDKFMAKMKKAQDLKGGDVKKVNKGEEEQVAEETATQEEPAEEVPEAPAEETKEPVEEAKEAVEETKEPEAPAKKAPKKPKAKK